MEPTNIAAVSKDPDTFLNYFSDLSEKQESSLLANKVQNIRNELNSNTLQTFSSNTRQLDTTPDQKANNQSSAILTQQFFVWKNGTAGRMTVDTPFGFKSI